ncbi:hypothetical protein CRYUN_Cryun14cG0166100 [Craigia yunnanensis]
MYELDKQKPEIWPDNDEEADQIINRFKRRPVRAHKNMINQLSENQLQKLCYELDFKIAAVMNAIKSKQVLTEGPTSPKMLGDSQGIGFLNKEKGNEVVIYQEPVQTQQDQSFQMLSLIPNFMESPMMMLQNGISYPEFDGGSSSSNIHYVDPSWMQPAYMNANSSMGYYDPTIYHKFLIRWCQDFPLR